VGEKERTVRYVEKIEKLLGRFVEGENLEEKMTGNKCSTPKVETRYYTQVFPSSSDLAFQL